MSPTLLPPTTTLTTDYRPALSRIEILVSPQPFGRDCMPYSTSNLLWQPYSTNRPTARLNERTRLSDKCYAPLRKTANLPIGLANYGASSTPSTLYLRVPPAAHLSRFNSD